MADDEDDPQVVKVDRLDVCVDTFPEPKDPYPTDPVTIIVRTGFPNLEQFHHIVYYQGHCTHNEDDYIKHEHDNEVTLINTSKGNHLTLTLAEYKELSGLENEPNKPDQYIYLLRLKSKRDDANKRWEYFKTIGLLVIGGLIGHAISLIP